MQKTAQTSVTVDDDLSDTLAKSHNDTSTDEINKSEIIELLNRLAEDEITEIIGLFPTDNPGRPRSILVGYCTMDKSEGETEMAFEILCTEQTVTPEGAGTRNNDGTVTFSIDELQNSETEYRYETVDLILYEKD